MKLKFSIGLFIALTTNYPVTAMDKPVSIMNLPIVTLNSSELSALQTLAAAWRDFYKNNDYKELMAHNEPCVDGCGTIYSLNKSNCPLLRERLYETACIVDMTQVKGATEPHYHVRQTEVYFIVQGTGIVVIGDHEYPVKTGSIVYIPTNTGHYTVPQNNLIIGVVNIPYFSIDDIFDLRTADAATRKKVNYDHEHYLHYANH